MSRVDQVRAEAETALLQSVGEIARGLDLLRAEASLIARRGLAAEITATIDQLATLVALQDRLVPLVVRR
ncbi:MAG: hypothetical protein KJ792_02765 [Actinobacteria bacterium]|nr:hypothetical protein [Actinomycetota bacterium]MCG2800487.1 hypothetical protein [Cellulomonas sp.]